MINCTATKPCTFMNTQYNPFLDRGDPDGRLARLALPGYRLAPMTPDPNKPCQPGPQAGLPEKPYRLWVPTPQDPTGKFARLAGIPM